MPGKKKPQEHPQIKDPHRSPGKRSPLDAHHNTGDEEGSEKHSEGNEGL
ncbi:hypothetical protein MASR2M17_00170 [Aminivibrio sp.]